MHAFYNAVNCATRDGIFILAVLAALAYGWWHYWWRTGFGRSRMALILALAAAELNPFMHSFTSIRRDTAPDHVISVTGMIARGAVLLFLAYFLSSLISVNVRRMRHPEDTAAPGRRHLERIPLASQEQIEKLTALWDEMHSRQAYGGQAAGSTGACRRHLELTPGATDEEIRELITFWARLGARRKK